MYLSFYQLVYLVGLFSVLLIAFTLYMLFVM